jgi:hypothetical protein
MKETAWTDNGQADDGLVSFSGFNFRNGDAMKLAGYRRVE